jgi:hypothetical protein
MWKLAVLALALQACAATEQGEEPAPGSMDTDPPPAPTPGEEDGDHDSDAAGPAPTVPAGTAAGGVLDGVPLGPPVTTPPALPQEPGPKLDVHVVGANGTGCPAGSWSAVTDANGIIRVHFDRYMLAAGADAASAAVQSCELSVHLETEQAVSFALGALSYEGHAALSGDASAELTFDSYFQGDPTRHAGDTRAFNGPQDADYLFTYVLDPAQTVWSTCGRPRDLNILLQLRLLAGRGTAQSTLTLAAIGDLQFGVRSCTADGSASGTPAVPPPAGAEGPGITSVTRR